MSGIRKSDELESLIDAGPSLSEGPGQVTVLGSLRTHLGSRWDTCLLGLFITPCTVPSVEHH